MEELNIFWAQWDPADYLAQLVADYEAETGIKVNVIQEPWGSFGDRFFTEMAAGGDGLGHGDRRQPVAGPIDHGRLLL